MSLELGLLGASLLCQAVVCVYAMSVRRRMAKVESRLGHHSDALSLLTETSESGFGAIARELERLGAVAAKPARRTSARRLSTEARKGRSVAEIAAAEGISEGEVHLRLHLAKHGQPAAAQTA